MTTDADASAWLILPVPVAPSLLVWGRQLAPVKHTTDCALHAHFWCCVCFGKCHCSCDCCCCLPGNVFSAALTGDQKVNACKWQLNYDLTQVNKWHHAMSPHTALHTHTVTIWQYCKLLAAMLIRIKLHLCNLHGHFGQLCASDFVCSSFFHFFFFKLRFFVYNFFYLLRSVGVLI